MSQFQEKPRNGSPKPGHRWAERRRRQLEAWYDYGRQCWVQTIWQDGPGEDGVVPVAVVADCGHNHAEPIDECYACEHAGELAERRSGLDRRQEQVLCWTVKASELGASLKADRRGGAR